MYAQTEQGRLLELLYDQMPGGASLCAVMPWKESIGDDETAFSISCQLRHQPAFPEICEIIFNSQCVSRVPVKYTVSLPRDQFSKLLVFGAALLVTSSMHV